MKNLKVNFGRAGHFFNEPSTKTEQRTEQEVAAKAAKRAKTKKVVLWGAGGILTVVGLTWVGKKLFGGKNKKAEEVEAPADENPAEETEPKQKPNGKKADK